jgi:hypothetical protein
MKEKETKPKEREVKASFKTKDVLDLKGVMKRFGNRYQTGADIYDKQKGILLVRQGGLVTESRFEQMERELRQAQLKNRPSPYYTTQRTDYSD